ncbi:MAG: hypothetical protein H6718_31235 [Polyangiaceae bacterium]|nr:hypothetical protein [Polyangiaceae bacterium]
MWNERFRARVLMVCVTGALAGGCALGPWYPERVESDVRYTERRGPAKEGQWEATVARRSGQLRVHLVAPVRCEVEGEATRSERVFETRDYNGMLAFEGTLAVMGTVIPFLIPSTGSQRLIGLTLLGLPPTTVFTVELLRPTHRVAYLESEPRHYTYLRRCPSRVIPSVLVELESPDGNRQSARTDADGVARFTVDPTQSVTVRVEGVADQVSPAEAPAEEPSE